MSQLVNCFQLTKSFSVRSLFKNIGFVVNAKEKIGLIGPNGAGKSTLLKIIAGQEKPDSGQVTISRGAKIGYLQQLPIFQDGSTILSTLLEAAHDKEDWEEQARAYELVAKLGLDRFDYETETARLSGGWKKRLALGRELMKTPDLMLLDEPTNHLDIEGILWLEEFIANSQMAFVTITHDRAFLQNINTRIIELNPRYPDGLLSVEGDYLRFLETKDQLLAAQEQQESVLKNTLRRETEWLRRGAKARTTKQQARIKRAGELSESVEDISARNKERQIKIEFQGSEHRTKRLISAKNISKSFQGRKLFNNLDLDILHGTRLALIGANGSGKSTLIKCLLERVAVDHGELKHAETLTVAYFDQNREALDLTQTVTKAICPEGEYVKFHGQHIHVRGYLMRFHFAHEQMDMPLSKLSGGEQSRLLIARLMLEEANLLVLDEPTNDLDLATLDVLAEVLTDFPGAVILVSHDRFFVDQVATQILGLEQIGSASFHEWFADMGQWEEWHLKLQERVAVEKAKEATDSPVPTSAAKKKKLSYKEQREFDGMESHIHSKEAELAKLESEMNLANGSGDAKSLSSLSTQVASLQKEIETLYERWAVLEASQQG